MLLNIYTFKTGIHSETQIRFSLSVYMYVRVCVFICTRVKYLNACILMKFRTLQSPTSVCPPSLVGYSDNDFQSWSFVILPGFGQRLCSSAASGIIPLGFIVEVSEYRIRVFLTLSWGICVPVISVLFCIPWSRINHNIGKYVKYFVCARSWWNKDVKNVTEREQCVYFTDALSAI